MIVAMRTDSAIAVVELWEGEAVVAQRQWSPGRQLSAELLPVIAHLLTAQNQQWDDITGVVVFRGPGSFTGLRIGITVANAISYSRSIPIVGTDGETWSLDGVRALVAGKNDIQMVPEYGALPNITKPRT